ncbi:MAG: peptidoglycan DD-metalloendopeptidase family protein [Alphaproteobacteria bacterium]|nr:peptidoglycan DD-metalloendopeptidase family protein [Alphaproteobacteria bacterium]
MLGKFVQAAFLLFGVMLARDCLAQSTEELQRVEKKLSEQKAMAESLEKAEKTATQELGTLKGRLIGATEALQDKQESQDQLEEKFQALEVQMTKRAAALANAHVRLSILAGALLRLSRQPPEAFLLRDALTEDYIHRALLLRALLPRVRGETETLARDLDELEALRRATAEQKHLVAAARQNLEWQRGNLDELIRMRQGLLQKTVAEKEAVTRQLAALADEAKDLKELLEKVSPSGPGKKTSPEATRLRKGLKMPVAGRVTRSFGAKDEFGVASQGLILTAATNSPIVAPQDGRVAFAGPFRGYGKMVILQHGSGSHSLLAGFGRIDAEVGQSVAAGEPLGTLAGKGSSPSELYFEWRQNGEAVDPSQQGVSLRAGHR